MIMGVCHCTALELSMMQDPKSLTLRWRLLLGGGSDMVSGLCAHKGGRYHYYSTMLSHSPVIIQDASPEISDAPLTLISRMGQWACHLPFYIWSWPKTPFWIDVNMQHFDCRRDQTKIVNAPLTLTLDTCQQSFHVQSFCLKFIHSLLTANISFLGRFICIQKHWGLSGSAPPLFTSSVW